jgi:ribonuclease P protein component
MDFSFPKKEKLKRKKLIEQLFEGGKGISSYPVKLIYLRTELPEDVQIQAGVTVSKRNFKRAVQRNRIKRLLRESYRLNKHLVFNNIEGNFAFLFLYIGKEMPEYEQVEASIKAVLHKFVEKNGKAL